MSVRNIFFFALHILTILHNIHGITLDHNHQQHHVSRDDTALMTRQKEAEEDAKKKRVSIHIQPDGNRCLYHQNQQHQNVPTYVAREATEDDPLPDVRHKRRKYETQRIRRSTLYYNNEVDFYQLLGLQELEKNGSRPETIHLYSPFFTEQNVVDALIRIHNTYNENNRPDIRVYASKKTMASDNLGKKHINQLVDNGIPVYIINNLHAKAAYIAYRDASQKQKTRSIMGSANISQPGFKKNVDSWMILPKNIEHDFSRARENISRNAWRYRGGQHQHRVRQENSHKQVYRFTPEQALLETCSHNINAQISQSIDNTDTGDTVIVNSFSCDDPMFIQALRNAHARGVVVDMCIDKRSHMPQTLTSNENKNQQHIAYHMACSSLYHDKTVCIQRKNGSHTAYYATGNRSQSGESDANLAYVTKNLFQTQSIWQKVLQKARKYMPANTQLNCDSKRHKK